MGKGNNAEKFTQMIEKLFLIGLPETQISTLNDSKYELLLQFDYPNLINNKILKRKENVFAF